MADKARQTQTRQTQTSQTILPIPPSLFKFLTIVLDVTAAADVTNVMVQEPTGTGQGLTIAPCLALHVDTLVFVLYVMVAGALITQNTDNNY